MLVMMFITSCAQTQDNNNITVEELKPLLKEKIQLVDVRTAQEYAQGHIKDAKLIDVQSDDFETTIQNNLDKSQPVYVYCRMGGRGNTACEILKKNGFKAYNLKGGFTEWEIKNKK